ncbi:MAG: hypothetical protein EXR72_00525 [Myxococcales bacterium]|nr:hypothetical protein [Myxococcales bacterium]
MAGSDERRIDAGDVTLAFGSAARWKARLREESLRAWSEKPLSERLRLTLAMIRRRDDPAR